MLAMLLLSQVMVSGLVVLAHTAERPGAPAALDNQQHEGGCIMVRDALRCAVCHAPGVLPAPATALVPAAPGPAPVPVPAAGDAAPPSPVHNPAAPPRAPPVLAA
jgi:hypothetical protein